MRTISLHKGCDGGKGRSLEEGVLTNGSLKIQIRNANPKPSLAWIDITSSKNSRWAGVSL